MDAIYVENLAYFARLLGYPKGKARGLVDGILAKVGLSEDASKRVFAYSGGMRKRLEVATALFPGMRILILDEPTTGLDPSARRSFFGLVKGLGEGDTTILLISHIGADAELASRVGLIDRGEIIAENEPESLKEESGRSNIINMETPEKSEEIKEALSEYSDGEEIMETAIGYRFACQDVERTIPDVVRSLDGIGCKATRIEIIKPSLEDVLFKLTGKAVREAS